MPGGQKKRMGKERAPSHPVRPCGLGTAKHLIITDDSKCRVGLKEKKNPAILTDDRGKKTHKNVNKATLY